MTYLLTPDKQDSLNKSLRAPCRLASIVNIILANVITQVDGVNLVNGDRVLVKDQDTGSENGIYVWSSGTQKLTLATDWNLVFDGIRISINEGESNADTIWALTTNDPITVGVTGLTFTLSGGGEFVVKAGDTMTGALVMDGAWDNVDPAITGGAGQQLCLSGGTGGHLYLTTFDGAAPGTIRIEGGDATGSGVGGNVTIRAGAHGGAGITGLVLVGGAIPSLWGEEYAGGEVFITGADGVASPGSWAVLTGGRSPVGTAGGGAEVRGATGLAAVLSTSNASAGGPANIQGGDGGQGASDRLPAAGGAASLKGGDGGADQGGGGGGVGGQVTVSGGAGTSGVGGQARIVGGTGQGGYAGGEVLIEGGDGVLGDTNGGDVTIRAGAKSGSGVVGNITIGATDTALTTIGPANVTASVALPSGAMISTSTTKPAATAANRGQLWIDQGGAGVTDTLYICMKAVADTYSWVQIVTGG